MLRTRPGRFTAWVAAAVAVLLALSACSSSGNGDSGKSSLTDVRIDNLSDPPSLDPLFFNTINAQRIYRLVYNSVLEWDANGDLKPVLAKSMPVVSADGLTYELTLKTGIKFQDGSDFTADDVVYTYNLVKDRANTSPWASRLVAMKSIEAVAPDKVRITLTQKFGEMPGVFALIPIISDKTAYEPNKTYQRAMNGTGPYEFSQWQTGVRVVLKRNENYTAGPKAKYATVNLYTVPEDATRIANLQNGTTQIVPDFPYENIASVDGKNGIKVGTPKDSVNLVWMIPALKPGDPTSDVNVRKAIAYAIDRQAVADQAFAGKAAAASTILSEGQKYWNKDLGMFYGENANVTKAKELLQAAGGAPSGTLRLVLQNTPTLMKVATVLQANLKEIGINVQLIAEDVAAYLPRLRTQDYDLFLLASPVTASTGLTNLFMNGVAISGSSTNYNKSSDAQLDAALNAATAASPDEAGAAWEAVQRRSLDLMFQIPIVSAKYAEAYSTKLGDYKVAGVQYEQFLKDGE